MNIVIVKTGLIGLPTFRLLITSIVLLASVNAAANQDLILKLDPQDSVAKYVGCLANNKVSLISAHRGGPKPGFPENALESMQEAVKHGPMLLEVDVRETADGELVLLHDTTLERTTTGEGNVGDFTLDKLQGLRLRDNDGNETTFTLPTLKDVLDWTDDRAIVQLDVKRGIDYAKVAKAVVEADAVDSVLIVAYRLENILSATAIDKNLNFSYTINDRSDLARMEKAGVSANQIVAWTGVIDDQDKPIWPVLESLNIPFATGAFWNLEREITESGNTQPYIDLTQQGVDVIASDHYWLAYDTLASRQDIASAISQCTDS